MAVSIIKISFITMIAYKAPRRHHAINNERMVFVDPKSPADPTREIEMGKELSLRNAI